MIRRRVENCVAWGSPGWGFVNHASYAHCEDNVAYPVQGAHHVCEAGFEIGSFEHNIALRGRGGQVGRAGPDGFGNGFWMRGVGVDLVDNVAAGHADAGFQYWTLPLPQDSAFELDDDKRASEQLDDYDNYPLSEASSSLRLRYRQEEFVNTKSVPLPTCQNNTVFASATALQIDWNGHNGWLPYTELSRIEDLTAYNIFAAHNKIGAYDKGAIFTWKAGGVVFDGLELIAGDTGGRHEGLEHNGNDVSERRAFSHFPHKNMFIENSRIEGFGVGIPMCVPPSLRLYNVEFVDNDVDFGFRCGKPDTRAEESTFTTVGYSGNNVTVENSEDATTWPDLSGVKSVDGRDRPGAGFQNAELSGNFAVKSHEDASRGQYIVHEDQSYEEVVTELKELKLTDNMDSPPETRATVTIEDVPEGTTAHLLYIGRAGTYFDLAGGTHEITIANAQGLIMIAVVRYRIDRPTACGRSGK